MGDTPPQVRSLPGEGEPRLAVDTGVLEMVFVPLRPVPGCSFADPTDGCCGHPDALTPECWVTPDGSSADCPITTAEEATDA